MEFKNIENELWRTYEFVKDGVGFIVTINEPSVINVSNSGGHRIVDTCGVSHYIPSGWVHLSWQVRKGTNPVSF